MFKKRVVRKMMLTILDGLDIGLRSYAMMRSATAGTQYELLFEYITYQIMCLVLMRIVGLFRYNHLA